MKWKKTRWWWGWEVREEEGMKKRLDMKEQDKITTTILEENKNFVQELHRRIEEQTK